MAATLVTWEKATIQASDAALETQVAGASAHAFASFAPSPALSTSPPVWSGP